MPTVPALWQAAAEKRLPSSPFLVRGEEGWREVGWDEAAVTVDELAAGFLSLGLAKGDRVAILSRTRLEWTLCDYALASIGAVSVPLYPTTSPDEARYILEHSGARALVCEDAGQLGSLAPLPGALEQVVAIEDAGPGGLSLADIEERGRAFAATHGAAVAAARAGIGEDDVYTVIYTSGTTGRPKGCVLAHRAYPATAAMALAIPELIAEGDIVLLFLPLAHTFARTVQHAAIGVGTIAFCPDAAGLTAALREVRPTVLPGAPRVFERVHAAVNASFERTHGARRFVLGWALRVGRRAGAARHDGRRPGPLLGLELRLADRLVFAQVKERLGGRLRHAISGGAPLPREVAELFHTLGILVLEGYGLTECAVVSVNRPDAYRFGTVGPPLTGVEIRVEDDGELLVRAESVFSGYERDEEETRAALTEDGWLRTGDIVTVDHDGFLTITDRKKDLIVTASGKNVAPQKIENALKASPYVSQALVIGNGRPFITALVTTDLEAAGPAVASHLRERIEQAVVQANRGLGRHEQIRRFSILERDFLAEEGEVTPTLKVRRRVCEEHFRSEIEALYTGRRRESEGE